MLAYPHVWNKIWIPMEYFAFSQALCPLALSFVQHCIVLFVPADQGSPMFFAWALALAGFVSLCIILFV